MTETCSHREPGPSEPSLQESIILAAQAHAASIRRTLWLKDQKRANGRAPATTPHDGSKTRGRESPHPIINGPIYSPDYWRAWQRRCVSRVHGDDNRYDSRQVGDDNVNTTAVRGGSLARQRTKQVHRLQTGKVVGSSSSAAMLSRRASRSAGSRTTSFRSPTYTSPTSSFAGGKFGTLIFASVPGSDNLLRAHYDAEIRPLLDSESLSKATRSSAYSNKGVRFSHNDPRPTGHNHEHVADGVYDIHRADQHVMPTKTSVSFRGDKASVAHSAIQGISKDTPGAIYDLNMGGRSATAPATRLSPTDRFPSGSSVPVFPGPDHYAPVGAGSRRPGTGAVAWTGAETFADSKWCRTVRPPRLRPWQGFGNGCSLEEHIDYGACLDGHCCTRHSVERRNALRVVQFLGQPGRFGRASRHRRRCRHLYCPRNRSSRPKNEHMGSPSEAENSRGIVAGSLLTNEEGTAANPERDYESDASTSVLGGGEVTPGMERAGRKRTPLHFASERGELSLVDRLCTQGDDRNAFDERGYTPLHDAADNGNTRVVSRLLQGDEEQAPTRIPAPRPGCAPADVNAQDNNGRTPLYLACLRGHERVVRVLLKAGADPDLVDIRGKHAQEVAGQQKIYQLLQFKADVSLVRANIVALEERNKRKENLRRETEEASAQAELRELKLEEMRLRTALGALDKRRAAYATAKEMSSIL